MIAKDSGGNAQENHDSLICHSETALLRSNSLRENSSSVPLVFVPMLEKDKLSGFIGIRFLARYRALRRYKFLV